jgi:CRISPR-associated protein Cmr4
MTTPYNSVGYYALALDPIHVGTGGYRLGRVDLSIVREPGTNLPKLPGTSLSGVTRACAAMATGRYHWTESRNGETYVGSCAGQGQDDAQRKEAGHCGSHLCPICVSFGFARGDSGGFQGLAQFSDVRILFFPVHSLLGPVWITSEGLLREHGIERTVAADKVKLGGGLSSAATRLNLGWLMLERDGTGELSFENELPLVPAEIKQRAVLVSDKLFSQIVNDNLEIRTSVSIDPATGAADDGALFTYEAIPRSTVLWFRLTYSDKQFFRIKDKTDGQMKTPAPKEGATETGATLEIREVVEKGLAALEHAGIGGMNTRGLGRLQVFIPAANSADGQQTNGNATATGGENES